MTESELKAIKWIENIKNDAIVSLQKEPRVNPLIYVGRKEAAETIIKGFEELEQYRSIGTIKKCQEAIKKQKPKKVDIWGDGYDNNGDMIYDMYSCPDCGKNYEIDYEKYEYCPNCGQKMIFEK